LQEITGIEDNDKIVEHLSSHQWNLEAAVQDALNEKEGIRPIFTATPPVPEAPPLLQSLSQSANIAQPPPGISTRRREVVRRQSWLPWTLNLAFFPLRFVMSAANEIFQFVGK